MFTFMKQRSLAVLALAALGLAPSEVGAQFGTFGINPYFQVRRGLTIQQAAFNTALMGRAVSNFPPYAFGGSPFLGGAVPGVNPFAAAALYSSPYGGYANPYTASLGSTGYGGYGGYDSGYGNYGESQLGGYMRGIAGIISSEGTAMTNIEQSRLLHEQVRRERLENRRRAFDQYLYFREHTPTPEDERQRNMRELVRRSLNDPPLGDITSGIALNTLLNDIQKKGDNVQGPAIALDNDILRHINVKSPAGAGNPGMLKNEGRLSWPVVLRGPQYKEERDVLNDLTPAAYDQAVSGKSDPGTLESMTAAVRRLEEKLRDNIKDLTPTEYSEGRRFLSDYEDALALLRQPGAGDYFTQKAPKGKSVSDLVQHMSKKGLIFAPAVPGDEGAYLALQRALAAYDGGINPQVVTEKTAPKEK
jgi:hypothetical protein